MRVTPISPIYQAKNPPKYKAQPIIQGLQFSIRNTETGETEACYNEAHMWERFDEINGFATAPLPPANKQQ